MPTSPPGAFAPERAPRCVPEKDEAVARPAFHHERVDGSGYYGKRREQTPQRAHPGRGRDLRRHDHLAGEKLPRTTPWLILRDRKEHHDMDCVAALVDAVRRERAASPSAR
jgi:hypothetical protein